MSPPAAHVDRDPLEYLLDAEFYERLAQPRFRGGALDNLENAPMGKGHGNDGKPFDIETACCMKPKFAEYDKARRNGTRLKIVDLSGVKTIKSFAQIGRA